MKLEEFKKAFENDAQKRSEQQEATIKSLHAQIRRMEITIHQLQNRCFVFTGGTLCSMCGLEKTCLSKTPEGRKSVQKEIQEAEYGAPRDE